MGIQGPTGTGDRFKNFVAKMKAKGKTDLQARRTAAAKALSQERKFKRKKKKK